ncbi:MAG TPA: glycosyltransferase [Gemmatimonadales bacterium]|nr:glycosyltransferase [Gemmatimonadales bacterium]
MVIGRPVAIYRDVLLAPSETFVRAQAEALTSFVPYYVGARATAGLELPAGRTLLVNQGTPGGRARELCFKATGMAPALVQRLRRLRPALIHAHFGPDALRALPLARRLGAPLVATLHGYDVTMHAAELARTGLAGARWVRHRGSVWREAALVLAVSEFVRGKAIAQGCPPERVVVHYTGVDLDFFQPIPGGVRRPIVLFVGRLVESKGCHHLIEAMRRVQEIVPDAELVVIGDGPLRGGLEALARSELERWRMLGTQPLDVVRAWLARARVLSVPGVTAASGNTEGFGMVFAEAQAMGTPVAGYAHGGIPEAVADGQTGLLVPEGDRDALADRLALLLSDDVLWRHMSDAGRRRVRQQFDIRRQTARLQQLYRHVLGEGPRPAAEPASARPRQAVAG